MNFHCSIQVYSLLLLLLLLLLLGLIACLIPYVYFSFQVGPLCFKSFELVPYVLKVSSWSKMLLTLE